MPGHVTPCVFLSSEPWLKQCAFKKCSLCLQNEWIHRKSVCLCNDLPQWFHESALKVHMIHCDSLATLAPVCLLCSERDLVCDTPCMVASLVTRHSSHSRPCHFAHTRDNLCSSLRGMEWFECTMHIACFHLVVTPLVCVHQEWWVLEH